MKNVIRSGIRRSAVGGILVSTVIAAFAVAALIVPFTPYLKAAVSGAPEISTMAGAGEFVDGWNKVVDFRALYAFDTGYYIETTTTEDGQVKSTKITQCFLLAEQDDCLFLIEVDADYVTNNEFYMEDTLVRGVLKRPDSDTLDMMDSMIADYAEGVGAPVEMVRQYYSLIYLDADETFELYAVLASAGYASLAVCLMILLPLIMTLLNPHTHKIYRTFGELGDTDEIEAELLELVDNHQLHAVAFTKKNFVFHKYVLDLARISVRKTDELCWVYWHVQKSQYGRFYYAVLRFTDGKKMSFRMKNEVQARNFVEGIGASLPVYYGYSKERAKEYKKLHEFISDFENFKAAWLENKERAERQAHSSYVSELTAADTRDENQLSFPTEGSNSDEN